MGRFRSTVQDQTLGKYSVVKTLGVGGMAEVYLCRLRGIGGFDKQVVVKRIRPDIKDATFVDMFLDEARVAANLGHQNIVQVFEIDEADGLPYIAMEYVRGPTLSKVLQRMPANQPQPYGVLACLFAQVAAGLHYAHNAKDATGKPLKIVHRDISPHNIIVSLDGTPKVFDFGVAKARGNLALTNAGSIKGKVAYMATEQLRALPVDYRADIYALGVCIYEATVGRRPFRGDTEAELFAARVEGAFPRPSELEASYPPDLEEVVLAAMDPDPDRRPDAADVQTALTKFATGRYAATTKDIADWIGTLFPDEGADELTGEAYVIQIDSQSGQASRRDAAVARKTPLRTPATRSRAPFVIGGVVALAAAGGIAYWKLAGTSEPKVAATPPPADAAPSPADQMRIYLAEAERLADERRWDASSALLAKARKLEVADATLDVRASKLADRVELGQLKQSARKALDAGDRAAASKAVDAVLDRAPDDADAQKLLAELQPAPQPAATKSAHPAEAGKLTVATRAGAAVYLDGALLDRGSFAHRAEPAGTHELVVRAAGFTPVHQRIRIASGQETKLEIALKPVEVASAPPPPKDTTPPPPKDTPPPPAPPDAAAVAVAPPPPPPPPHRDPPAPPDAGVPTAIAAPRLPASYSARTMKELQKVLGVVEGEAIDRGNAPSSIRGVTSGIAEEAFSSFAPGQLIEVHPSAIYYAIVRATRAGKNTGSISAELRTAYTAGRL